MMRSARALGAELAGAASWTGTGDDVMHAYSERSLPTNCQLHSARNSWLNHPQATLSVLRTAEVPYVRAKVTKITSVLAGIDDGREIL